MKKTPVVKATQLPQTLEPVFAEFNRKVEQLDADNATTNPTVINWTDMARAAVTWARSDNAPVPVDPTSLLQEIKAAKNAILRDPKNPSYVTETFLDEFIQAAMQAATSKTVDITTARNVDKGEIVRG
jgi:hypothetical protein